MLLGLNMVLFALVAIGSAMAANQQLIMYGGAWKGPHAEQNVMDAVALGYRAFDTANVYAASYNETAVGAALERARASGLRRDELFIQTKFTPGISKSSCPDGPWDPEQCMFDKEADLATQVKQSAQTSLSHLRVTQLDSLVLHEARQPWEDLQLIWRAMEDLYADGTAASIGVSHAHDPADLRRLLQFAKVMPSFVQNPVFASNGWDREIREICREHGIVFQAYSLNHAENDFVYQTDAVQRIARRLERTPQQVIVAMTKRLGLLPLVGPQDPIKMAHAVSAARHLSDRLTESEVTTLEHIADLAVGGGVSQDGRAKVRRSDNVDSGTLQGDDAKLTITVKNELGTDVYVGWQTPDHSSMRREQGMHVAPDLIAAGRTQTINTFHRHGFYFWDAVEGDAAPLHREGADKRWVRRLRADGFKLSSENDVVVDERFQLVVVNLGLSDNEVFFVRSDSEAGIRTPQGVAQGGGGSVQIWTYDGHTFDIRDSDAGTSKRVTVRRSNGDPQLLPVGVGSPSVAAHARGEL